ncbi:hypothetical protein TNCV_1158881 [Trichonephila clavipes]|nr:hypothetical protein TNCV_1158881 [Trichonephila clavipes]
MFLSALIRCQRVDIIDAMEGITTPQDLRALIKEQFDDADYFIRFMQRTREFLTGRIQHRELQPFARDISQRLYSRCVTLKNDIIALLDCLDRVLNLD